MPATNSAIETTRRNRAMKREPSLYKNLKRYQKNTFLPAKNSSGLSKEETEVFRKRMARAKRKGLVNEFKFYGISTIIGLGLLYFVFQLFF